MNEDGIAGYVIMSFLCFARIGNLEYLGSLIYHSEIHINQYT